MIDRISPTKRPDQRVVGHQSWRSLLFLHWPVSIDELRPLVPKQLELDLFDGVAYIGVVPFLMRGIRTRWWPKLFALNFLEINVRTYVHCKGRPGVYFFSLDANSLLAVLGARYGWSLPYFYAKMQCDRDKDVIEYSTTRRANRAELVVKYQPGEMLGASEPESMEHFFLERYLLFAQRGERILVGQVHHEPYPAQRAEILELTDSMVEAAGLTKSDQQPEFVHFASGVDVEVFGLEFVD